MTFLSRFLLISTLVLIAGGCGSQDLTHNPQPDKAFTLQTALIKGKMVFIGVGGEIDRLINPDLNVQTGDTIRVTLVGSDSVPHDFAIPELNIQSQLVVGKDVSTEMVFVITGSESYAYFCAVSGHRQAGMEGSLIISKS